MRRILRYLQPYWKLLAVALAFLISHTATELLRPYITKIAIDRYIASGDIGGLDSMVLIYAGTVIAGFIFVFIQICTTEYAGRLGMVYLRMQIIQHLTRQEVDY